MVFGFFEACGGLSKQEAPAPGETKGYLDISRGGFLASFGKNLRGLGFRDQGLGIIPISHEWDFPHGVPSPDPHSTRGLGSEAITGGELPCRDAT